LLSQAVLEGCKSKSMDPMLLHPIG
jgi:hypothetical protein